VKRRDERKKGGGSLSQQKKKGRKRVEYLYPYQATRNFGKKEGKGKKPCGLDTRARKKKRKEKERLALRMTRKNKEEKKKKKKDFPRLGGLVGGSEHWGSGR